MAIELPTVPKSIRLALTKFGNLLEAVEGFGDPPIARGVGYESSADSIRRSLRKFLIEQDLPDALDVEWGSSGGGWGYDLVEHVCNRVSEAGVRDWAQRVRLAEPLLWKQEDGEWTLNRGELQQLIPTEQGWERFEDAEVILECRIEGLNREIAEATDTPSLPYYPF